MKTVDFSKSIAGCDQKVSRCRQLIDFNDGVGIEGQGHFFYWAQCHLHMKIKTGFSQKPLGCFEPNLVRKLSGTRK